MKNVIVLFKIYLAVFFFVCSLHNALASFAPIAQLNLNCFPHFRCARACALQKIERAQHFSEFAEPLSCDLAAYWKILYFLRAVEHVDEFTEKLQSVCVIFF